MVRDRLGEPRRRKAVAATTASLRRYADRGVFRGFRAVQGRAGRCEYQFVWLTRQPMTLVFDPSRGALTFRELLPSVAPRSAMETDVRTLVLERSDRRLPAHKRLDLRKARLACSRRGRALTLTVTIRGAQHDYAVRSAIGLVHELFLLLQETYPDYLIEHFGASAE